MSRTTTISGIANPASRLGNDGEDELLTLREAAALVRVPEATLRYWRHLGEGPHSFKVGRTVRYWRTEVLDWLIAQSQDHTSRSQQP